MNFKFQIKLKLLIWGIVLFSSFNKPIFSGFNFTNNLGSINFTKTNSSFTVNNPITNFSGGLVLKDNVTTTISGSATIGFSSGVLTTGKVTSFVSGTFDPTGSDAITLSNNDYLDVRSGTLVQTVNVANGATGTITGQPLFANTIILGDSSSVLQLGLTVPLSQSVTGAGKVSLLADLTVGKNIQLPSLVAQNNYTLTMTGGTISTAVTNTTGGIIELAGNTTLSALWTIGTGSDVYVINGNGCVLDLSGTGGITFNGTSLYLNNVNIKGVQTANAIKGSGNIYLSKVTITLSGDFVRSDGSFYVHGDPCRIITSGNTFTMDGAGHNLTVDKQVLSYEQLNGTDASPFLYTNGAQALLTNGGLIASAIASGSSSTSINSTSYTQLQNIHLTANAPLNITNATPGTPKAVAYDGSNLFIHFPNTSGNFLNLDANVNLTMSNVVLKDFHHSGISYGSSATNTFSDNVRIELGQDLTIATGDTAWTFNGNAEIDGNGSTLTLQKSQGITITGAKNLSFKNMRLIIASSDAIKCLTDTAHILFQNIEIVLKNTDFTFSAGNIDILDSVSISGGTTQTVGTVNFDFTSKGYLKIGTSGSTGTPAELKINNGINFKYEADPTNDSSFAATKQHFVFNQKSSKLILDGCSLESTTTGLTLNNGVLEIRNKVYFKSDTTAAQALDFGLQLIVNVMAGATMEFDGILNYSETQPVVLTPLKYGDSFVLQHKTYGFYFSLNQTYNPCSGTAAITSYNRLIITPFNAQTNGQVYIWGDGLGGSLLQQPVKSGDLISFCDTLNEANITILSRYNVAAAVSTPMPPYMSVSRWGGPSLIGTLRIFKKGGAIGDTIYLNDDIYVDSAWNYITFVPCFLGSSNLTSGSDKEVYWYDTASGFPPNFTTNFLWNFVQHQSGTYSSLALLNTNRVGCTQNYNTEWAPYFVPGGAHYIDPSTLQI